MQRVRGTDRQTDRQKRERDRDRETETERQRTVRAKARGSEMKWGCVRGRERAGKSEGLCFHAKEKASTRSCGHVALPVKCTRTFAHACRGEDTDAARERGRVIGEVKRTVKEENGEVKRGLGDGDGFPERSSGRRKRTEAGVAWEDKARARARFNRARVP
eukprot:3888563-Pleurochrysis_carterae.AAC.2